MRRFGLFLVTVLILLGLIAAVQKTPPAIQPTVTHSIGAIQPRISPNGETIAVSYQGSIWTIPRTGGVMTRLTHDSGFDIEPVSDGERIAYVNSQRFGSGQLRIVTKTGEKVEIAKRIDVIGTSQYYKLEWLTGDRLLGAFRIEGQNKGIGWVNIKTGEAKSLVEIPRWSRYAVSPDERWLVYTSTLDQPDQQMGNDGSSTDVWRVSLDGSEKPEKMFRFPSRVHDMCWLPGGLSLCFVSELGGGLAHNDLWQVPLHDAPRFMRRLTLGQADEDRPSVSRDGRWLVYTDNQRGPTSIVVRDWRDQSETTVNVAALEFGQPTGRLKISVVDRETGEPTTGRISITKVDGKMSAPPGSLYRVLDDVGHFYCEGSAEWDLPAGEYRIRAYHGLEYRPFVREVYVISDESKEITLKLERWAELPKQGWHSGENHIHANYGYGQWYSSPRTMLEQCAGEGIGICNFMVSNSDTDGIFDREFFRGRPDDASTNRTILYWNQEFRSTIWGHMTLVNLKQVVEPIMTGFKETTNPWDVPTNSDIAERTHWQRGHVNYTHVAQNPDDPYQNPYTGKGIPVDVALGMIDTLDLNASYAGTVVLWHRLLNCGFHLAPSAGTDCFLNRVASRLPGADRVYVRFDGPLDYGKWIEGLRAGRSFVTNGPMVQLSIGPHQLGDTLKLESARKMTFVAKADSHFPMNSVDVIYNGKTVATAPLSATKQQATLQGEINLDRSGWLAVRVSGPGNADHPAASLDAHTSPIYVEVAGSPPGSREDAEFFLKWIDRLSLALRLRDRIPNDSQRRHVEEQLEAARAVYHKIAESGR